MYADGQLVKVKKDGVWIAARFAEVAQCRSTHIDDPRVNDGAGYESAQAWVIYDEGELALAGTGGLHPIKEEIRPGEFQPS